MLGRVQKFIRSTKQYRDRYGFWRGTFLAAQIRCAMRANSSLTSIKLPGIQSPLFMRPRTVDFRVFEEIFVTQPLEVTLSRTPKFIVDAGAHIGLSSRYLAHKFPMAKILSLEVEQGNFEILKKNAAAFDQIVPLNLALWRGREELVLRDKSVDTWAYSVREPLPSDRDAKVQALGVSDLMDMYQIDEIDFLKVDIEGAEKEVFGPNAEAWLGRVRMIAVELHEWLVPGCKDAFEKAIKPFNYQRRSIGDYILLERSKA